MSKLNLAYPQLLDLIGGQDMTVKQQSKQLLKWFLQNYYNFDEIKADECLCDDNYDKGTDGIYIDEHLKRIDIFCSEIGTKTARPTKQWVKETDLKEFAGTLKQYARREIGGKRLNLSKSTFS